MNRFTTYWPSERLRPFVHYFAISEMEVVELYKVLPSKSLVMGFQYRGRLVDLSNGLSKPLNPLGISGLQDRYAVFQNTGQIGTVLVYFREMGGAAFFKMPIHELFAERVSLDTFIAPSILARFEEELVQAGNDTHRLEIVEAFLISQLSVPSPDLLVAAAVQKIQETKGLVRIRELAQQLNSSQSPLEKRFRRIVGASPKKFASIVRLEALLATESAGVTLTELAYQFDYFDQAHFIRDFKKLTGETPAVFYSKTAGEKQ